MGESSSQPKQQFLLSLTAAGSCRSSNLVQYRVPLKVNTNVRANSDRKFLAKFPGSQGVYSVHHLNNATRLHSPCTLQSAVHGQSRAHADLRSVQCNQNQNLCDRARGKSVRGECRLCVKTRNSTTVCMQMNLLGPQASIPSARLLSKKKVPLKFIKAMNSTQDSPWYSENEAQ